MPNVPSLTLALWATNLATPLNGLAGWTAHVDSKMAEAAAAGAKLLVMPEYACESWLAFKPEGLAPDEEIAWMARQAPAALALLRPLPAKHGVALRSDARRVGTECVRKGRSRWAPAPS